MKKLKWITVNEYVEKDTGEVLNKKDVENKYEIIKKIKHVTKKQIINYKTGWHITEGIIKYTNECRRRSEQLKLF